MARRIVFITGARSEYDILSPVLRACASRSDIAPAVIAGAGHLSPFHGSSIDFIRADGVEILAAFESLVASDTWVGRSLSFAQFHSGLTNALAASPPDMLVIAGDREEALAGALVGNFLRIPVAHLFGGDRCLASDIDEVLRPAISKLSHLHFTATEGHRERLLRMGERPEQVWTVGATSLDRLDDEPVLSTQQLSEQTGVDVSGPFFLLIQHPSPTLNIAETGDEMRIILDAVLGLGLPVFCSYPNFDPGNVAMREAIDAAAARWKNLHLFHTLSRNVFVNLFRRCAAILGNSSSIVIEAGFLKKPGILIGPRQNMREVGTNVLRVDIEHRAIQQACRRALDDAEFAKAVGNCASLYGDGKSGLRVASILASTPLDSDLLLKTIAY